MKRFVLLLLLANPLLAQSEEPPAGPLLKRAPEFSSWIVTFSSPRPPDEKPPSAGQEPPSLRRIVVTKTGEIRQIVSSDAEGRRMEIWAIPGLQAVLRPEWAEPLLTDGVNAQDAFFLNFHATDFPGFEWVSAGNFRGVEKVGERECLVFQDRVRQADATAGEVAMAQTAFVDLATRLPVKLDNGGEIANYRFESPPTAKLRLPADVLSAIEARAEKAREITRKPARPF